MRWRTRRQLIRASSAASATATASTALLCLCLSDWVTVSPPKNKRKIDTSWCDVMYCVFVSHMYRGYDRKTIHNRVSGYELYTLCDKSIPQAVSSKW